MNKISKKIVALATMAAFVLTLVPAAAFAATGGAAVEDASYYEVVGGNATVEINDVVEKKDESKKTVKKSTKKTTTKKSVKKGEDK